MRWARLSEFRDRVYTPGSRPSIQTLRSHNRAGLIRGGMVDARGRHWVDLDEYADTRPSTTSEAQPSVVDHITDPVVRAALGVG